MAFSYTSSQQQGITIFNLSGEIIDKVEAVGFVEEINKLASAGKCSFILELSGLRYMNSSGLNVLVNILTKARNTGGEVVVCNLSKKVKDLLVITKLDTIFHILPTVEDAIKKLKSK
ncbi:MAG: STAS domain-containing protein [Bacteroidia bacterium]|jgi:anti-sigma B factor antagonist